MLNHPAFSYEPDDIRTIVGIIESIIYINNTIAVVSVSLCSERIKAVLSHNDESDAPKIGETWALTGKDQAHLKYGEQFIVSESFREQPKGPLIIKYIQYHAPGISKNKARLLWNSLDIKLYDLLDNSDICSLTDKKIGNLPFPIANLFIEKWHTNKIGTEIVRFFQKIGLSTQLAISALRFYGKDTIQKIQNNPYRLLALSDFQLIDAQSIKYLSIENNDHRRMNAAVEAAVYKAYDAGHTAISEINLIKSVKKFSQVTKQEVLKAINQALLNQTIVSSDGVYQGRGQAAMEQFIARKVAHLCNTEQHEHSSQIFKPELITEFEQINNIFLTDQQKQAVEIALTHRISIIQGTKGVGKATCLSALYHQLNSNLVIQVAHSGRAAKQMAASTQMGALTISAFLLRVSKEPLLDYTKLVVSEASMIDVPMMIKLLRSLPFNGSIVLIGDSWQLPPIGPGLVLHALCDIIPAITLTQVQNSTAYSCIPVAAQLIGQKQKPIIIPFDKTLSSDTQIGLCHIASPQENISHISVGLRHFIRDWGEVQIIAPTVSICDDINMQIHNSYRNDDSGKIKPIVKCTKSIGLDDRIVCTTNMYHKGLTDGSVGRITRVFDSAVAMPILTGEIELCYAIADFDGQDITLSAQDLSSIKLGYCITCKKAKGSEFERVIIAMTSSTIIDNTWLYTAVTCAKKQVMVIGDIEALNNYCITPSKINNRCIALPQLIQKALNEKLS